MAGSVLFVAQQGLGLGLGTMERVAAFPLLIWTCHAGVRLRRLRPELRPG